MATKLLGTNLDESLYWDQHIEGVKLNKAVYAIKQLKPSLNTEGLVCIYFAMAYSHINLNIMTWGQAREFSRDFVSPKPEFARQNLHTYQSNASTHEHQTKHGDLLRIPKHKTKTYKKYPHYNAIVLHNKLPRSIKDTTNNEIFNNKVKSLLLEGCY